MGFSIKDLIKTILGKGIRVGYSTGPMFDPRDQKRTGAVEDLVKQKSKEEGEKWE